MRTPKYEITINNDKKENFYRLSTKQLEKIYSAKNRYLYNAEVKRLSMGSESYYLEHTFTNFRIYMQYWGVQEKVLLFDYNFENKIATLYPMSPISYDVVKALSAVLINKN